MLLDDRRRWLADRAALWATVVRLSSEVPPFGNKDARREIETHLYGAHICVLAIAHFRKCIKQLKTLDAEFPPLVHKLTESFEAKYDAARMKDVRDALEHEEDRVAGKEGGELRGHPEYAGSYPEPMITGSESGRLTTISVLDERFRLSGVVDAALALEKPLFDWSNKM